MNWKRICRALICLLVICCLLVNMSPIRAKATSIVVGTALSIAAVYVVSSALIGLGVLPAPDTSAFDKVVNDAVSFFEDAGIAVAGMLNVWALSQGNYKYAVDQSVIEALRDFLFSEGVVVTGIDKSDWVSSFDFSFNGKNYAISAYTSGDSFFPIPVCYRYAYPLASDGINRYFLYVGVIHGANSIYLNGSSRGPAYTSWFGTGDYSLSFTHVYSSGSSSISSWSDFDTSVCYDLGTYTFESSADFYAWFNSWVPDLGLTVAPGLVAGEIAAEDKSIADGYATWAEGAISIPGSDVGSPDDDYIPYWPIGLGQTIEETKSFSQTDVWNGTSTYEDSKSDTDAGSGVIAGTISDVIAAIKAIPSTFQKWFEDVIAGIKAIPDAIGFLLDAFSKVLLEPLASWFNDVKEAIIAIPDVLAGYYREIVNGIQTTLESLFVPDEGYITEKVDELKEKYVFAFAIIATGISLMDFLSMLGSQPPIIYIDLGSSRGSYDLGGKVVFVDLTWYAEYKPTVDTILSAFILLWFAWRLLLSLPGIISGTSGFWGTPDPYIGFTPWSTPPGRLNSGDTKTLGTSNYHKRGAEGRHYIKHDQ